MRSLEKGDKAKESIEQTTGRQGVVEVWQLDLASYESTKQFAKRAEGLKRLDAVVENAGIARETYSVSEDNESTITTNVVSTFLLGLLLLPKLRESGKTFNTIPVLTVVSSEVHGWTSFEERKSSDLFKTMNDKETANMAERWARSTRSSQTRLTALDILFLSYLRFSMQGSLLLIRKGAANLT